jgi:predicted  nucleic acid-binding Zn-ribbon protein
VTKILGEYKSPAHKVLALLHKGREQLRQRYRATREELRVAQNQVRAVETSRQMWRDRAEVAQKELAELKKKS